jgi:hypothetical protein
MIGLREVAMVAAVVLVLYGRTNVIRSRRFQAIWPWIAPVRRKPGQAGMTGREGGGPLPDAPAAASSTRPRLLQLEGNRLFWFLTILAATAVASLIIGRALVLQGAGPVSHP